MSLMEMDCLPDEFVFCSSSFYVHGGSHTITRKGPFGRAGGSPRIDSAACAVLRSLCAVDFPGWFIASAKLPAFLGLLLLLRGQSPWLFRRFCRTCRRRGLRRRGFGLCSVQVSFLNRLAFAAASPWPPSRSNSSRDSPSFTASLGRKSLRHVFSSARLGEDAWLPPDSLPRSRGFQYRPTPQNAAIRRAPATQTIVRTNDYRL